MMDKTFSPAAVESRVAAAWRDAEAFKAGRPERAAAAPFSIVIPPPNVTGSLHLGHALNCTLQDVLCRFERMRGKDVLWQPGTDHAGIATQMVVERQLAERGEPGRRDLGRAAFLERVWAWKAESGGAIVNQLQRLGASCDWSRERFTMDEGLSRAVRKVFVALHREGLIYKDKRLVNWDPKLVTAISDLEVVQSEVKGSLWHFKYPIDGSDDFIIVATTRPETMLGDTAVAVHPENERLRHLIGRQVALPLVGRLIPVIGDDYADPEKGTGAVKITPAHDFNDFEVGRRHGLAAINILDREGRLALRDNADFLSDLDEAAAGPALALDGLDRFEARVQVVALMQAQGLLDLIEPHVHSVPHGDRSGVVIEPFLTDQWYVDAKTLAAPALEAVRDGRTTFTPKNWEKTYFDWLENIQPWCISRQLWWGHQIPAWYGPDGAVFVAEDETSAAVAALAHYGAPVELMQDEDVLDTWFSSGLWPFSTLGWPDRTPELARFYPTSLLVTGFDIIFFWVARMMMMGLHTLGEVPFRHVYIHALVRDEKGAKMAKSKGNVIDPLKLIDEFGADALRFTLAALAAPGRDVKMSTARVEGYRSFATKLWNAARFAEMNGCIRVEGFDPQGVRHVLNRWIIGAAGRAAAEAEAALEAYRFDEAASAVYRFTWNILCDWHLEFAKPLLQGDDEAAKAEARATIAYVLDIALKLLHPFMPFITEELWAIKGAEGPPRATLLTLADWPDLSLFHDGGAANEIDWLIELIGQVRSMRAEMRVPAGAQAPLVLVNASPDVVARARAWAAMIGSLARVSSIEAAAVAPHDSVRMLVFGATVALPLEGLIDVAAERARIEREIDKAGKDNEKLAAKLADADFIGRAPEEVVEVNRARLEASVARVGMMRAALSDLRAA